MAASYETAMLDAAHDVGVETAQWFSDEFDKLLMPMFTVSQFVKMTGSFRALPDKLAMAEQEPDEEARKRLVNEVCTDPEYLLPFKQIVDGIRQDANLSGVLFNVRLSPGATTCLIDRATNEDDYADIDWTYDSTGEIGRNWLGSGHPMMEAIIRQTLLDDVVTVAGPMAFDANSNPTMDMTRDDLNIKEFFCAHLAINLPGYELRIDDEVRPTYGYVQVFFDWARLKERSGIYDRFGDHGILFKLTRSDTMYDADTDTYNDLALDADHVFVVHGLFGEHLGVQHEHGHHHDNDHDQQHYADDRHDDDSGDNGDDQHRTDDHDSNHSNHSGRHRRHRRHRQSDANR